VGNVNYIQHQIDFFKTVYEDDRLSPYHISLYMALFQFWNYNRFKETFSAARGELMQLSKVKSKSTYSKCLNELNDWKYIIYSPSNNPFIKSTFNLSIKWTSLGLELNKTSPSSGLPFSQPSPANGLPFVQPGPSNGLVLVPDKTYKHKPINNRERPSSEILVIDFFKKNGSSKIEGQKFWNHYESNGWLIGGKTPMVDWQASARNWIIRSKDLNIKTPTQKRDYLHTSSKKNYNEPL